jgi:hypothetical protein
MYSSAPAATGRRAISTTLLPHPRSACHLPTPYDCTAPAACRAPQQQRTKMKGLPWEVPCTGNLFCHYNYMPHKKSSVHRDSARIDHPKTASGPESSFSDVSLTRQAQTNRYDRRIPTQTTRSIFGGPGEFWIGSTQPGRAGVAYAGRESDLVGAPCGLFGEGGEGDAVLSLRR